MKIVIKAIPHDKQRYDTVGDYWVDGDGTRQIRVSQMVDPRYELLVALHELIEQELCLQRGISEEEITAFDKAFEAARNEWDNEEPGDNEKAPYRKEHFFATSIERLLAAEFGVDWAEYDDAVMSL